MTRGTITFQTRVQAALWKFEIQGQISDGMWENTKPHDHYKFWCSLDARVGEDLGVSHPQMWTKIKDNYSLTKLVEYVGDRMMNVAKMATVTDDERAIYAADHIDDENDHMTYADGGWRPIAEVVDEKTMEKFRAATYTEKDLLRDLREIKRVMKIEKTYVKEISVAQDVEFLVTV